MQPEKAALLRSLLVEQRVLSLAVVADDRPVIGLLPLRAVRGQLRPNRSRLAARAPHGRPR